jgi:hypothetical protein
MSNTRPDASFGGHRTPSGSLPRPARERFGSAPGFTWVSARRLLCYLKRCDGARTAEGGAGARGRGRRELRASAGTRRFLRVGYRGTTPRTPSSCHRCCQTRMALRSISKRRAAALRLDAAAYPRMTHRCRTLHGTASEFSDHSLPPPLPRPHPSRLGRDAPRPRRPRRRRPRPRPHRRRPCRGRDARHGARARALRATDRTDVAVIRAASWTRPVDTSECPNTVRNRATETCRQQPKAPGACGR